MAEIELNSSSQDKGFDPDKWSSASISHNTNKNPFYGFKSAKALESCLNEIVLPRLQSMKSASSRVFVGVGALYCNCWRRWNIRTEDKA